MQPNTKRYIGLPGIESYNGNELFLQIAQGDEQAFKQLYLSFLPRLRPFIRDMLKSAVLTDDTIQDAFIRIWLNRDKLPEIEQPAAWIFKIAANECYKVLRKMAQDTRMLDQIKQETPSSAYYEEHSAQYNQTRQYVSEAISSLTPQRRKIYEMSRLEGKKPAQIAAELNLSVSTVKNTLSSSLEMVRAHLLRKGVLISLGIVFFLKKF